MNWYRVTFSKLGKRMAPVEVAAHDASDALYCAGVKAGLNHAAEGEVELVDMECIEEPEHAKMLARLKQHASRGVLRLCDKLDEMAAKDKASKPAGDA